MSGSAPISGVIKRDGLTVRYQRGRIAEAVFKATASVGKPNLKLAESVAQQVERTLAATYGPAASASVEDIQDIVEDTLMQNRLTRIARNYIIYRHHRAEIRARRVQNFQISDTIPYRKVYEVLLWNLDHGCDSVSALNRTIRRGDFPALVAACERRLADEIRFVADDILDRIKTLRLVIVAGPSSSGKTTTLIRLADALSAAGVALKSLNIDHYFFDLEQHPRDEFGDYDYETPQALDLERINRDVVGLLEGRCVRTPHYDFKTGTSTPGVHPLQLAPSELLLIDSLHGLHADMTSAVPADAKFRVYVETLGQLRAEDGSFMRWADNRLLRRMIRDRAHRNVRPLQTLTHWHYVRNSELRHIIPFVNSADAVVNSALPYEAAILKPRLYRTFAPAIRRFQDEPGRRDACVRARRVRDFLRPVKPVTDDGVVPPDSLLREFIGGSRYRY